MITAVVLAAGVGARVGADRPKQLLELHGRTIVEWSAQAFLDAPSVDRVIVMAHPDHLEAISAAVSPLGVAHVLVGGVYRHDSVRLALEHVPDGGVLVHDAARPLVSVDVIERCVEALDHSKAVGTFVESADTVVRVDGDRVVEVLDRSVLRRAQTPQGFDVAVLRRAHELAAADPDFLPTDDCGVVLRYLPDEVVTVVTGDPRNLKVTEPEDVAIAEALLDLG